MIRRAAAGVLAGRGDMSGRRRPLAGQPQGRGCTLPARNGISGMAAPVTLHLWAGWPHVLRAQQFDPPALERIFREAQLAEEITNSGGSNLLKGKIILTLFYEPSTRTRLSFEV